MSKSIRRGPGGNPESEPATVPVREPGELPVPSAPDVPEAPQINPEIDPDLPEHPGPPLVDPESPRPRKLPE